MQVITGMKMEIRQVIKAGLDARVVTLQLAQASAQKPAKGWLRAVRSVLGLSQALVAKRISVARQSYADLEAAEERGAISLNTLQGAAEAMDCDLVYYIVPRRSVAHSFEELVHAHDPKSKHLRASEHSMALENQAVGDLPRKTRR